MRGAALALLAAVLFGASTPASKWLLARLGPLQLAGLLYLGAAVGLAPWLLREGRGDRLPDGAGGANARRLLGAVVCGGILGPVLLLLGLARSGAAPVSLWLNLELVATAVLGALCFRDPLGRRGWSGVGLGLAAGAALAGWQGWPGVAAAALVAGACVCWGLDNHWTALVDGWSPARIAACKGAVAGAATLGLGVAFEPWSATPSGVAAALAVGALGYGASVALYVESARQLGATRAQGVFASAPFLGAALAFALLGESFTPAYAVAGALLAVSVLLLSTDAHEHAHVHEARVHVHSHRHDDGHHGHAHPGLPARTRHTHWHRHEPLAHRHAHQPDLHHRHEHAGSAAEPQASRPRRAKSR